MRIVNNPNKIQSKANIHQNNANQVLLHGHCYQKARPLSADGYPVGVEANKALLEACGYQVSVIDSGCCGMAGAFGYEKEHYSLSIQVGELGLLPAVRAAGPEVLIAASGVSCRSQIVDNTQKNVYHPVELVLKFAEAKLKEERMPAETDFWLQNPVATNFLVTSRFNDPRDYGNGLHEGIDLNAVNSSGSPVAVLAAQRGVVDKVGYFQTGYGNYLRLKHAWADGSTYVTWYGHLSSVSAKQGDFVQIGQKIGLAGDSGNAEGIHLHLTLQHIGHGLQGYVVDDVLDPLPFFRFGVQPDRNEAQFISDVTIPDGTSVKPGTAYTKTWRLRNSGTRPWTAGYQLAYFAQERMGAVEAVSLPPAAPGEEVEVSLNLVAPTRLGRIRSTWKGRDPNGVFFEFPLWVEVVVAGSPDEDGAVFHL